MNRFSHIDLRVTNAAAAKAFYGKLLPALGYSREFHGNEWFVWAGEGALPQAPFFGFTEDPRHVPNGNRIAFWAADPAGVDAIGQVVKEAGGRNLEGPGPVPEYGPNYYAVFFEDPCGNRLEVCHRTMG